MKSSKPTKVVITPPSSVTFRCQECVFIAKTEIALRLHTKVAHKEITCSKTGYRCARCFESFSTEKEIDKHVGKHLKKIKKR